MTQDVPDAWRRFGAAYEAAKIVVVFWCPTIDDLEYSSVGSFCGGEALGLESAQVRDGAERILASYFEPFEQLKSQRDRYKELLGPLAEAVAASCQVRHNEDTRFADLAEARTFGRIVSVFGTPIKVHPSFGFWFQLEEGARSPELDFTLGFQVEAGYDTTRIKFETFWKTCRAFMDGCGQRALRVLLDDIAWEVNRYEPRLSTAETVWHLETGTAGDVIPRLVQDRLRYQLTSRMFVANSPVHRWPRQVEIRSVRNSDGVEMPSSPKSLGATLVIIPDVETIQIRISGYSQWLFEALFPTIVMRVYEIGKSWDELQPPDPILLSADQRDARTRMARFTMYQPMPPSNHCLCGDNYPYHEGRPSVVALRESAVEWISRAYEGTHRIPEAVEWSTLSSPRTYFDTNPEITSSLAEIHPRHEEVRANADLIWRRLLNTVFEGSPLEASVAQERASLSMTAECNICKEVCCRTGTPLASAAERSRIVEDGGFEDFFVPAGDSGMFWIGKRRDGQERRRDADSGQMSDPCPYYDIGRGCLIHEWKPLDCVLYPYRTFYGQPTLKTAANCPSLASLTAENRTAAMKLAEHQRAEMSEHVDHLRQSYAGSWVDTSEEQE